MREGGREERDRGRERERERERERKRKREREREEERDRERGGGGRKSLREEGRRGKAVIAKRILNELEKYAHHSSWLMGRFGTPTATFGSPCWSSTTFNINRINSS